MTQSFQVERVIGNQKFILTEGLNPLVSPVNVGPRTTPNYYRDGQVIRGATSEDMLDSYTRETIVTLKNGTRIWAGQLEGRRLRESNTIDRDRLPCKPYGQTSKTP